MTATAGSVIALVEAVAASPADAELLASAINGTDDSVLSAAIGVSANRAEPVVVATTMVYTTVEVNVTVTGKPIAPKFLP